MAVRSVSNGMESLARRVFVATSEKYYHHLEYTHDADDDDHADDEEPEDAHDDNATVYGVLGMAGLRWHDGL